MNNMINNIKEYFSNKINNVLNSYGYYKEVKTIETIIERTDKDLRILRYSISVSKIELSNANFDLDKEVKDKLKKQIFNGIVFENVIDIDIEEHFGKIEYSATLRVVV